MVSQEPTNMRPCGVTEAMVNFALTEAAYRVVRIIQRFQTIKLPDGVPIELTGVEKQTITLVVSITEGCGVELRENIYTYIYHFTNRSVHCKNWNPYTKRENKSTQRKQKSPRCCSSRHTMIYRAFISKVPLLHSRALTAAILLLLSIVLE